MQQRSLGTRFDWSDDWMVLSQQLRQPTGPQFCSNSSIRASSETGEVWDGPVDSDGSLEDSYASKGAFWIPGHARG